MDRGISTQDNAQRLARIFRAGGEFGQQCRDLDWAETPLGPVSGWSEDLCCALALVLGSPLPMALLWGPDRALLYNAACRSLIGADPGVMGRPVAQAWPALLAEHEAHLRRVVEGCASFTVTTDQPQRAGAASRYTLGLGPALGADGSVAGVLVTFAETTELERARDEIDQLEDRVARQRTLFEAVLEQLPTGVSVAEAPSGKSLYHNREAARLLGHEPLTGTDYHRYAGYGAVHPDGDPYRDTDYPTVRALLQGEVIRGEEMRYCRGDDIAYLSVNAAPIYGPDGKMIAAVSSFVDVGDFKHLQEEYAHAAAEADLERRRLTAVLDVLPVGIWMADVAGRIISTNPTAAAIWGGEAPHPQRADEYHRAYRAYWPDGRALEAGDWGLARALQGEASGPEEVEIECFDGGRKIILNYGVPILGAAGEVVGGVAASLDITARKRAEQAVADSERRFRHMADHAPVMVWTTDPSGYCTYLSRTWCEFTGQRQDEGLGYGWLDAVHPDDRERARQAFAGCSGRKADFRVEYRLRRQDGSYRWALDAAAPWIGEDGLFRGYIGSVIDITERRDAEATLRQANEDLERRVREEVEARRQAQEQLLQAQKMEALGQLTGGVAHDFNNILAATITSLELVLRRMSGADGARLIENALRSARRGAALTDRLLAFARKQRLEARPCELSALIHSFAELLERTSGAAVRLELHLAEGLWLVRVDPAQFESALLNLAVNAGDAMPEGGRLCVETRNVPAAEPGLPADLSPGDYVRVRVTDTGCGMSAEVAGKAFDPFYTTKAPGKGTGLGLSQVYGFAKQSGGTAVLHTREGEGTWIDVYLPRSLDAIVPEPETHEPAPLRAGAHLLVVDDDEAVRVSLAAMLRELDMRVEVAESAEAGLQSLARGGSFDAVLVDYAMPGMSGTDFIRVVRDEYPQLGCLLITGYVGDESARAAAARVPSLRKPFSLQDLVAAIGRVLH